MKFFFSTVRELFGRMTQGQVEGMNKIVEYGVRHGVSRLWLAYVLATVYHETGRWMQPIREGGLRNGPATTEAQAVAAITAAVNKGLIKRNYALPVNGKRYYGRGLIQITWYENYLAFGIEDDPDKALEWETALDILFRGMETGMFRKGNSLAMIQSGEDYIAARGIVNGDVQKNGPRIAQYAQVFFAALRDYPPTTPTPTKEDSVEPDSNSASRYAPAWWPF